MPGAPATNARQNHLSRGSDHLQAKQHRSGTPEKDVNGKNDHYPLGVFIKKSCFQISLAPLLSEGNMYLKKCSAIFFEKY